MPGTERPLRSNELGIPTAADPGPGGPARLLTLGLVLGYAGLPTHAIDDGIAELASLIT